MRAFPHPPLGLSPSQPSAPAPDSWSSSGCLDTKIMGNPLKFLDYELEPVHVQEKDEG